MPATATQESLSARQVLVERAKEKLRQRRELAKCKASYRYFLWRYGTHVPAKGGPRQLMDYREFQDRIAEAFEQGKSIVVLKTRRAGLTQIAVIYMTWLCLFQENGTVASVSHRQDAADKIVTEIRKILSALPAWMRCDSRGIPVYGSRATMPDGSRCKDTQSELGFASGCTLQAYPPTGGPRGATILFVLWDEAARIEPGKGDPQEVLEALDPAIEGGGQMAIVSTGRGRVGNGRVFSELWDAAVDGTSGYIAVFISWADVPGRTTDWLARKFAILGERKARQEYPSTPEEGLEGDTEGVAFSRVGINHGVTWGAELWQRYEAGELPPAGGVQCEVGMDNYGNWGCVLLWPLEHGSYLVLEEIDGSDVPDADVEVFMRYAIQRADELGAPYGVGTQRIMYDSAGTMIGRTAKRLWPKLKVWPVQFGGAVSTKTGRMTGQRRRANADYLQGAFLRGAAAAGGAEPRYTIAFAPSVKRLVATLKVAKMVDGKLAKIPGEDDIMDALIAGVDRIAGNYERVHRLRDEDM